MIYLDQDGNQTICECDRCGTVGATDRANGVIVDGWGSGQLWVDISLAEDRQMPLCFCPACAPVIRAATRIQISAWGGADEAAE
ncbi:MAG: hypothetical protein Q4G24_10600 [Paracoccus sp. (in: a-proteobacteria)]|uniref:hypothetical protein n=1 Tax=Paracoccus sp. TaxID=267 RepID=UPI0026E0A66C|nr:hypothetical protein [Paracoccus sp. (in: a-proteobacteria)]MDO5621907.1 hypothetical protein [Paracoccus sp. (in: a-proteobacteria)]